MISETAEPKISVQRFESTPDSLKQRFKAVDRELFTF